LKVNILLHIQKRATHGLPFFVYVKEY